MGRLQKEYDEFKGQNEFCLKEVEVLRESIAAVKAENARLKLENHMLCDFSVKLKREIQDIKV